MTNFDKLKEIFPHVSQSSAVAMMICPAVFYGLMVCPFPDDESKPDISGIGLIKQYHIDSFNSRCAVCARMFWKSEYDGAEDISVQKINASVLSGTKPLTCQNCGSTNCRERTEWPEKPVLCDDCYGLAIYGVDCDECLNSYYEGDKQRCREETCKPKYDIG